MFVKKQWDFMKHQTCSQNFDADNCNILKFNSTCSSRILWIKLIHRDLVEKVHSEEEAKKILMYKFSGSHKSIYIPR
jgi:hypothetical protein